MILAYVDESGDVGYSLKSSPFYVLSAVAVPDYYWDLFHNDLKEFLDKVINTYNEKPFKIEEIHFREFKNGQRKWLKSKLMNYFNDLKVFLSKHQSELGIFSVAIKKQKVSLPLSNPLPATAIKFFIERLSGFAKIKKQQVLIIVDNSSTGLHSTWRKSVRTFKEHGTRFVNAEQFTSFIIEEAVFVDSVTSPEIQLADTLAGFVLEYLKGKAFDVPSLPFYKKPGGSVGWGLKIWP